MSALLAFAPLALWVILHRLSRRDEWGRVRIEPPAFVAMRLAIERMQLAIGTALLPAVASTIAGLERAFAGMGESVAKASEAFKGLRPFLEDLCE